jgi:anti-sigma B factor antagonist
LRQPWGRLRRERGRRNPRARDSRRRWAPWGRYRTAIDASFAVADLHGHTVLAASGEIDIAAVPAFRDQLRRIVEDGSTSIVIDLTGVRFIDSAGLRVLVDGLTRARRRDAEMRVACPSASLRRTFEISGLDKVMSVHTSVEEATS